jgi:hypothetical protein
MSIFEQGAAKPTSKSPPRPQAMASSPRAGLAG